MCTFELDVQLLGKTPQVALQVVPPTSDAFHLLAQEEVLLLPICSQPVGFIQSGLQPGILFFQLVDRSQLLCGQSSLVVSLLKGSSQVLILLRQSFFQFFCKKMMIGSEKAKRYSSLKTNQSIKASYLRRHL